jgi:hypothetical protein
MLAPTAKRLPVTPKSPPQQREKKARSAAPLTPLMSLDDMQMLDPVFHLEFAEGYAVDCSDYYDEVEEAAASSSKSDKQRVDKSISTTMMLIPGRYFKVAENDLGAVFRQEHPIEVDAPNTSMLFLHCVGGNSASGWYISTHLDLTDPENEIHAWGKANVDRLVPDHIHVPYWSKKANHAVSIQPLLVHNEHCIKMLIGENERLNHELQDLRDDGADKEIKMDGDKGKGKGYAKNKKGGGWMNRTVPLAVAIVSDDMAEAKSLVKSYTEKFSSFGTEVEKGLKRRSEEYMD